MSTALTTTPQNLQRITTVADLSEIGQIFVKSGFFQDTRDAAQAIVKVMAGQELGFAPIASMTGVYIVKGKVSLSANLMAAAIKRSGRYTFRVRKLDASACEIEFFEMDKAGKRESLGVSGFTIAEAQQAGLAQSATWKNFPRNMLYARAMSNGAKWYCPDVFGGPIYTPDELGAVVDGETGEVIDLEPEPPAKPATPLVKVIDAEPVEVDPVADLGALLDALNGFGVSDEKLLAGINNLTGANLPDLEVATLRTMPPDALAKVNHAYGLKLDELTAAADRKREAQAGK